MTNNDDDSRTDASTVTDDDGPREAKKPSAQIMRQELKEALAALDRSTMRLFFSGISAGLELGFSIYLMGTVHTLVRGELPPSIGALLVANMYAFGFILVILGRSELFTEQTSLAVLPVLSGQASIRSLLRLWGIVYVANLIGAVVSAGMMATIGPALGTIDQEAFTEFAFRTVDHSAGVILGSAILAGWLMGLLSWLVAAGRDTISQVVMVWLITTAIGLGHLHHSILGTIEVFAGIFSGSNLTLADFGYFIVWTTAGNAIGGPLFLAILKYSHARPAESEQESI